MPNSKKNLRAKHVFVGIWYCAAVLFSQVPKKCIDLDLSLLYILISRTYGKFARKNDFLALGVYFAQPCSSAGRRFAASGSRLYYRLVTTNCFAGFHIDEFDEMPGILDSTENPCSFEKYPTPH